MILVFLLYFLYATIFVIGKCAITISQPIFLTGVRMTCAGILSYGFDYWLHKKRSLKYLSIFICFLLFLLAFFNVYVTNAGEFWSLQYLSASKTSFIYNMSPFFILIFSALLFSEKITLTKCIGMLIGFCSLVPLLLDNSDKVDTTLKIGFLSLAELVMLGACIATSLGWVLMKYFVNKKQFSPYFLNGISLTLGGLMCLVHAYFFEPRPFILSDNISEFLFYMLSMMLIQNVVAYNLHAYLLEKYSATLISLASFVMPLYTIIISHIFLAEPLTPLFFICSAGVGLSLCIFYFEELKQMGKK